MQITDLWTWVFSKAWVLQVVIIVLTGLLLVFLETRFYKKVYPKLNRKRIIWNNAFLYALHRPLILLIVVLSIIFTVENVGIHLNSGSLDGYLDTARNLTIIILFTWFLLRFIAKAAERKIKYAESVDEHYDRATTHAISQLSRITVVIITALLILQNSGIEIGGLLAVGGLGGVAIGFAAKDLLANLFGGLMIFLDQPFAVGDWIRSADRNIEGTVEEIGWRLTTIRTFDKRPLYIPNGIFSTIAVENPSRMHNRRIKAIVGLRYADADKMPKILADIEEMLREHQDIDSKQTLLVNFVEFAASSLNFMIYTFTKTTNWVRFQEVQQDVFFKVIDIITKHQAEIAFPTSTLHVPNSIKVEK